MDIDIAISNFNKNGFIALRFKSKDELIAYLKSEIKNKTVGMGGSVTLDELGVFDAIKDSNDVSWHAIDNSHETFEKSTLAQVYILSANAVSATGEIVNIDGRGNRVASSIYGPNREKVIYIIGENKIEPTLEKAMWRAKNISAPLNAKRLGKKTPCAIKADKCYNCNSPQRICRATTIIDRPTSAENILIFIEGNWGY